MRERIKQKLLPLLLVHHASPEKLAASVAFGVGSIFIPAPGVQTPFLIPVCWAMGLQLPIVYVINWINNPATWIPICISSYSFGRLLLEGELRFGWPEGIPFPSSLQDLTHWEIYQALLGPWLLGSFALVVLVSLVSYYPALFLIRRLHGTLKRK